MTNMTQTVLLVIASALSATTAVAEDVEKTIDASAKGNVSISNIAGSIEVTGWSRNEVKVIADLGRGVDELIVERDGDEVIIKVKAPKHNARSISSDLTIHVPENSSLEVVGVSADIEIDNVFGELRLHTVSGDMESEIFGADAEVETVSGDIELRGDSRDMRAEATSVSGDVEVDSLAGSIEAVSVSGDVAVMNGSFDYAEANTVSGDIDFRSELRRGGKLEIETINGSVDVVFKNAVSARFNIETFNGSIRNCFGPKAVRTSRYAPGKELNFTEGDGDSRVTIETLNGSISLCRD
ncbi:MAG: DUF4097 family beta strand repeat protein [Gammaproteobacteria bacterium]|nr:DUF4097 family beta strand repeat protein [Gammaproteobacteria bacterium]